MNTARLKRFATEARTILMQGVANRLQALGFDLASGQPVEMPLAMEGGAVFMGDTVTTDFYSRWMSLHANIQARSVKEVAEEAAYTWFNRLMAITILSRQEFVAPVLDYESPEVRVPMIVSEARQGRLPLMSAEARERLTLLLDDDSRTSEQFALLIVAYCHATPVIDRCFGTIADYTELLLPHNILSEGGFVDMINHTEFITPADYRSPELIGWLYQFYISDRKDEAFAKKGKFDASEIPAATQIFTPNWIVKYMVENTIGRIYLDNNPYSDLKDEMRYLVDADTEGDTIAFDDLADLRVADLACGSGHILNECFDLLYAAYKEEGYSPRQAVKSIFEHNLTGVDLDLRAKQLATFALLMKACQKDRDFLSATIMPRVYTMPRPVAEVMPANSLAHDAEAYLRGALPHYLLGESKVMVDELTAAILLMNHADSLGSIMKFSLSESTRNAILIRTSEYEAQLAAGDILPESIKLLMSYMHIILALTERYHALVMNPPYMGSGNMNATLADYVKNNYAEGKADLFSVFMLLAIDRLRANGKYGMINMQSWMFLSSFEGLRTSLLSENRIESMLHLGPRTFDELSGEVVQNTAFVIANAPATDNTQGTYFRLVDGKNCTDKERMFLSANSPSGHRIYYPNISQKNFSKIPGCPIGYWVSERIKKAFKTTNISKISESRCGLATGNNDYYIRLWSEISFHDIGFAFERNEARDSGYKWFPYNNAGGGRKWYGLNDAVINWFNDGEEMQTKLDPSGKRIWAHNFNLDKIFKEHGGWSDISSKGNFFRYYPKGYLFTSNAVFADENILPTLIGYGNSKLVQRLIGLLNPTMHFTPGNFNSLPFDEDKISNEDINPLVESNISISKEDWDAHETSWDFAENPLLATGKGSLREAMAAYKEKWKAMFHQLHQNEEELNRQFIAIYGLEDELTPDVPLSEVTILQQGEVSIEE